MQNSSLKDLKKQIEAAAHEAEQAEQDVKRLKKERRSLLRRQASLDEAQVILQGVAANVQASAQKELSELVTKCLRMFREDYAFEILLEEKRGKTEARPVFVVDGEYVDPLSADAGGFVDIASFALRLSVLCLSNGRKLLIMDEAFKHLSADYRDTMAELLTSLAETYGVQIIMVTHADQLEIGHCLRLS